MVLMSLSLSLVLKSIFTLLLLLFMILKNLPGKKLWNNNLSHYFWVVYFKCCVIFYSLFQFSCEFLGFF